MMMFRRLVLVVAVVTATPELAQIHVITRHGSRTSLQKQSGGSGGRLVEQKTGAILTALGEKQLYDLGDWLRERYAVDNRLLVENYQPHLVHFQSSDLERTISSANALTAGLYPPTRRSESGLLPSNIYPSIPVYMEDDRNDIYIRAYNKCPKFNRALKDLYDTTEWTTLEQEHHFLLDKVGTIEEFNQFKNKATGKIPLRELWNVFDAINVAKTECVYDTNEVSCANVFSAIDDDAWTALKKLAHKAEMMRYSTAGDLLGANLMLQIHQRMGGGFFSFADHVTGFRKLYHYSAHYPTILSLFSALNIPPPDDEVIPGYGAAFIFELYKDITTGITSIKLLYKEANAEEAVTIQFPQGPCFSAFAECDLPNFTQLLKGLDISSPADWCAACENDSADVCLAAAGQQQQQPAAAPTVVAASPANNLQLQQQQETSPQTTSCASTILGALFGGIGLGMLFLLLLQIYMSKRNGQKEVTDADSISPDNMIDLDFTDIII